VKDIYPKLKSAIPNRKTSGTGATTLH